VPRKPAAAVRLKRRYRRRLNPHLAWRANFPLLLLTEARAGNRPGFSFYVVNV